MTDPLVDALLAKPVGPTIAARTTDPDKDFTRKIEVTGDVAAVTVRGAASEVTEGAAAEVLRGQGLDPVDWIVTGFRSSEWTMATGELGVSTRFSFTRSTAAAAAATPPLDELFATVKQHSPKRVRPEGEYGLIVALGDMQFGKIDGDGVEGTLRRTVDYLDKAADLLAMYALRFDIGHVHLAWLGDHIEGFVSQGGANVWRTPLSLSEQIRLTRRVMLHGLVNFADLADRVTMAAVPGNHGEPQRFAGKGVTRYDDSHDTESLIAVSDAAALNPEAFGHVEFYVPQTDEMTVLLPVAGTTVAHAHGHQWRIGKHFDWWRGQAFRPESAMHQADLLLAGHLHHEFMESDGKRLFMQVPSLESESTWYRHSSGTGGNPGLVVAITKDGSTTPIEVIR